MSPKQQPAEFLTRLFGLEGRVAIVTGGAGGLGTAFSRGLAVAGARIVIVELDEDAGNGVVAQIEQAGGAADLRRVDVTDSQAVAELTEAVSTDFGRIDILVNNAGTAHRSSIEEFPEDEYDRVLALNLKGTYLMAQAVGRKMLAQGSGSIINIASIGGCIAYPHASAYLASKGGVVQLTRAFALEWVDRGVRVNAIAPGLVDTQLLRRLLAESSSSTTTDFIQERMLRPPLLQPDDLVAALVFLAGDGASKVTGHILAVDDGYLIQ